MEVSVRQFRRRQDIWGIGLNAVQAEKVRAMTGRMYSLTFWNAGEMPNFAEAGKMPAPCMICFGMDACREFMHLPIQQIGFLELTPKVLFLDEDADMATIDEALSLGVSDIIRPPVTKKRFAICLRKASEAAALQRDIQNMTHEVFMEREVLERKNKALSFLVDFLSRISESQDETEILSKAFTCLQNLFPVITMHAGIFSRDDSGTLSADLFIAAPQESPAYNAWCGRLLETSESATKNVDLNPAIIQLQLTDNELSTARPEDGHILTLPVHIDDDTQLYLMLLTSMERNLSRDQALALDSALRHMAVSIQNVRRYQEACHFADRDSLTGAYNRRYFERILLAEVARHQRYSENLSLLILDIDHFKNINDTYGHLKGDEVLRAIVSVITTTIRQTDYCVRYGGEEFVILLPHTSNNNAVWLAERLRKKTQKLTFKNGKERFSITASIGVASLAVGECKNGLTLTNEADMALYMAKNSGRNKVMAYELQEDSATAAASV